ncbi:MAG: hypothetical protein AB7C89_07820 [Intestinibacillus sp.]
MKRELKCLRCGTVMRSMGLESIQLGHLGLFLGQLDNRLSGTLEVEIMVCPSCRKLEFYERGGAEVDPPANPARLSPAGWKETHSRPAQDGYHVHRRGGRREKE